MKNINRFKAVKVLALIATMSLVSCFSFSGTANAEGSKELVSNGGYRPFIENRTDTNSGLARKTKFTVYAKKGEVIYLGSSVYDSNKGYDITVTSPEGTINTLDVLSTGEGYINTIAKESAGPNINGSAPNGYTPLAYNVEAEGLYTVEFFGKTVAATDPTLVATNADFLPAQNHATKAPSAVAAFDISVYSPSNGNIVKGRVWADYFAISMGANATQNVLMSDFYVLTHDGYTYKINANGMDPYGFILLANNKGIVDVATGEPIYRSMAVSKSESSGVGKDYKIPVDNTTTSKMQKIFINIPSADLPASIPTTPKSIASFGSSFNTNKNNYIVGEPVNFNFEVSDLANYSITISFDNPAYTNVILAGVANGKKTVMWDGKDGNGNTVGKCGFTAKLQIFGGEYHFPMVDVENNKNGIKVELLDPPANMQSNYEYTRVFYDNSKIIEAAVASPVPVPPRDKLTTQDGKLVSRFFGTLSNNGTMSFTGNWGNDVVIDLWQNVLGGEAIISKNIIDGTITTGTIEGTVYYDNNKNKKIDNGESYVSNISVDIKDSSGTVIKTVLTDGSGKYSAEVDFVENNGPFTVHINVPNGCSITTTPSTNPVYISDISTEKLIDTSPAVGLYAPVDLSVNVTANEDYYIFNEEAILTVKIKNNSTNVTATTIVAQAPLPAGVTYVSDDCHSEDGCLFEKETGLIRIPSLAPGAEKIFTIKVKGTELKDNVEFKGDIISCIQQDTKAANNSSKDAFSVISHDIAVEVTTDKVIYRAGDIITYKIKVTNMRQFPVTGAYVDFTLPADTTLVGNEATYYAGNRLNFGNLAIGEVKELTLTVKTDIVAKYTISGTGSCLEEDMYLNNNTSSTSYGVVNILITDNDSGYYHSISYNTESIIPQSKGVVRFLSTVFFPSEYTVEKVGTYMIPLALFEAGGRNNVTVQKNISNIESGDDFHADLDEIPLERFGDDIFAVSFIYINGVTIVSPPSDSTDGSDGSDDTADTCHVDEEKFLGTTKSDGNDGLD